MGRKVAKLYFIQGFKIDYLIICLSGMDGNMVLDEIQRVKYRHCYKRKTKYSLSTDHRSSSVSSEPESSEELPMPDLIPIPRLSDNSSKVDEILKYFMLTLAEVKFEDASCNQLSQFHQKKACTFPWDFLISHLNAYAAQLRRFAQQITDFQLLPCGDELLDAATNMYMHYILAKYLTATSGSEQLYWLFDGHLEEVFNWPENGEVQTLSQAAAFAFLAQRLDPASLDVYIKCIKCITMRDFPKACNGLVANFLLYQNYSPSEDECNRHRIEDLERQASDLIISECNNVSINMTRDDLEAFSGSLQLMAHLIDLRIS